MATELERWIAKHLGLSDAQLAALLRIKAGFWPGNAAAVLERKGLAYRLRDSNNYTIEHGLTDAGKAKLAEARRLGF